MSSSAFTPTTTQVTTEVPVNVPIITDWTAYTPTLTNFGSKGTNVNTAFWRRNGADIEIIFTYNGNSIASGAGSSSLQWSLPSGLTFDVTKLPSGALSDDNYIGSAKDYSVTTNSLYSNSNQVVPASATTFSIIKGGSNIYFTRDTINISRNAYFSGQLKAPISQWAGSGTTTLADRALEEYASNSGGQGTAAGTSYTNTSFVVYGPNGSLIPSVGSTSPDAATEYIVRFQSQILPTDTIILELNRYGSWLPISSGLAGTGAVMYQRQAGNYYGIGFAQINGSTTDCLVQFGNYGARPPGPGGFFAGLGETWSTYSSVRWRLRKVSSGAQVGYPISTKNIVGATDGVAPVTGMLGESTAVAVATSTLVPIGTVAITGLSQTLSAGTWAIFSDGQVSVIPPASGLTAGQNAAMDIRIQNITDSTTLATCIGVAYLQALSATTVCGGSGSFSLSSIVQLSSPKTFQVQGTYQSNITGGTTQTVRSGRLWAVRIA